MKNNTSKKSSSKKSVVVVSGRGHVKFAFVKSSKKPLPAGIMSVVFKAIQTKKVGTVVEVAAVAIKQGLKKVTDQNPVTQTHVMLNRLRVLGLTKRAA